MKRVFMLTAVAGLCLCLAADVAYPGLNAGATARIYWLTANSTASTSQSSTSALPKLLITVKGVSSFRGADVQLWEGDDEGVGLPAYLQTQAGGCAEGYDSPRGGGFNSGSAATWPSIFSADPPVPELSVSRPGSLLYNTADCWAPSPWGMIWYSASGSAGVAREPATEYGVFGLTLVVDYDCMDPPGWPKPAWIWPVCRQSCHSGCMGSAIAITDANGAVDYVPFEAGYGHLTLGYAFPDTRWFACTTPVAPATWGSVRRLYR
jgi:hypothetical protein